LADSLTLTTEMMAVLAVLALTIGLFVTEIVRVDIAAILIMVLLGITGMVPGDVLFNGFASNAVISIIAVMIIGAGLDKTGVMSEVAIGILRYGGKTEKRIIPLISSTVGVISSFMQNVGAAALFLPVVGRISAKTDIPMSRLLMPMGFCAILGGTLTMVGSSPLILLNDLILTSNAELKDKNIAPMDTFNLFDVTPIGIVMLTVGIIYFIVAGRFILPVNKPNDSKRHSNTMEYFKKIYGLEGELYEVRIPHNNSLVGNTIEEIEPPSKKWFVLASRNDHRVRLAPPRDEIINNNTVLALFGQNQDINKFAQTHNIIRLPYLKDFSEILSPTRAGISEVVIPPSSSLIGKKLSDVRMRKTYGTSILTVHRNNESIQTDLPDLVFSSGDTLVLHSTWEDLAVLDKNRNFVVASDYPREEMRPNKVGYALLFFAITLLLIIFMPNLTLSVALMVGAMGMVISGVLSMDEAYQAVSWKTVFLLASLIPLGVATETSGTAAWIAQEILSLMHGVPIWGLQLALAVLATFFTLVMSNVGATVLLVPLAVNIALGAGADPRIFALTVALAASNSFLIPTHQVNALIMGPAGYRVVDFIRAGSIMTILFLAVIMIMLNIMY